MAKPKQRRLLMTAARRRGDDRPDITSISSPTVDEGGTGRL
ncbi:hypothetical protein [Vibrio sp. THAF191d]|nr:hypothetical protein [Vibrio sp. THAF191d]